ncbi:MAG: DegT/DnrJ/EryC1/StrS family aminotransferase, partial [Steroidobacteraceae bacterium]
QWSTPNGPKAILPVHLYGTPAPSLELRVIADKYGLKLVEDACQAHGARLMIGTDQWVRAGTSGAAGCFSFYPGKNLGAWGEAGAIATDDAELAERVLRLRDHGRISHYAHAELGYNARLDAVQAAVLRTKLKHLDRWNARRREIAATYRELLKDVEGAAVTAEPGGVESCYHLFVIRSAKRDLIRNALLANHIECGIHYPLPLHLQPACRELGYGHGDFPASEEVADTVLSLPIHPYLADAELVRVVEVVRHALDGARDPLVIKPNGTAINSNRHIARKREKELFAGTQYGQVTAVIPPPRGD